MDQTERGIITTDEDMERNLAKKKQKERMYYADWLRVIAVHSVIFVHCLLNAADTTEMYDRDGTEKKEGFCKIMTQVGMPMFFYISGMSSTFYNAEKNNFLIFVKSKVERLLYPLVLGSLVFLVPRLYLMQEYEPWTRVDNVVESNYLVFTWKTIPYIPAKISWLWFLPVLFVVMILNYPLLVFSQRRKLGRAFDWKVDGKIIGMLAVSLLVWCIPCATMVNSEDAWLYLIPSVMVLAGFNLFMMLIQLLIPKFPEIAFWIKLAGPVFCVLMNCFKHGQDDNGKYGLLISIHYNTIFLGQGMIDQLYLKDCLNYRSVLAKTIVAPLSVGGFFILHGFTAPTNYHDTGFLFYYPIYYKLVY
jgi:hypothetical protein